MFAIYLRGLLVSHTSDPREAEWLATKGYLVQPV